jgi:hypothetical protein
VPDLSTVYFNPLAVVTISGLADGSRGPLFPGIESPPSSPSEALPADAPPGFDPEEESAPAVSDLESQAARPSAATQERNEKSGFMEIDGMLPESSAS